jgi:hypothetical protein
MGKLFACGRCESDIDVLEPIRLFDIIAARLCCKCQKEWMQNKEAWNHAEDIDYTKAVVTAEVRSGYVNRRSVTTSFQTLRLALQFAIAWLDEISPEENRGQE